MISNTWLHLHDGTRLCGLLEEWHPRNGWLLLSGDDAGRVLLDDVETAYTTNVKGKGGSLGTRDDLARARREGWQDPMTREARAIAQIRRLLYWDHANDEGGWLRDGDPGWVGFDELSEIDGIFVRLDLLPS